MTTAAAIDLVVTDLDGTLWETDEHLHPATAAAIVELERRGVPLLVATGRRLTSTRGALAPFGLAPPAVVLNGALLVDLANDERMHRQGFDTDVAVAVLDAFVAAGLEPCVYVDHPNIDVFVSASPSTHPEHLASFGSLACRAELAGIVRDHHVLGFSVLALAPESLVGLGEVLAPIANPHVSAERQYGAGLVTITVAPPRLSKWDGIEAFCRRRGLDAARVLAIGDGPNDLEMLDGAAIAVAPADAHPEALARADHVVARAADGGWAELLNVLP